MRNGLQCYCLVDESHVVCLVLRAILMKRGCPWTAHGRIRTVKKQSRCACWTEIVHVNLLEFDGMDCVKK